LEKAKARLPVGPYNQASMPIYQALDCHPVKGMKGAVFGSEAPWLEAMLFAAGECGGVLGGGTWKGGGEGGLFLAAAAAATHSSSSSSSSGGERKRQVLMPGTQAGHCPSSKKDVRVFFGSSAMAGGDAVGSW
jgi:hypothetical protein